MPSKTRQNIEKFERERPTYTIYPNGEITVAQTWIPGHHLATKDEMLACDGRREVNAMGEIIREEPLRSPKRSPTRRHRAANSGATALPPPAFVIDLTIDNAAQVPPAAQATTSRMENAIFVIKHIVLGLVTAIALWQVAVWVAPNQVTHLTIKLASVSARLNHFLASFWESLELIHGLQTAGRPIPRYFLGI